MDPNLAGLVTVTVTYHPEPDLLRAQLEALPKDSLKLIVDNASGEEICQSLRDLRNEISNLYVVENPGNMGLAAALNQGVSLGRELRPEAAWCLLLDQDSEPYKDCVAALIDGFEDLKRRGEAVGCVGPVLVDARTGLTHGFHQMTKWRWRRAYPANDDSAPVRCASINGSGTLAPIRLFFELGRLDESLFIDHIDTDWSFRVLKNGYSLWGIPQAKLRHRMGENSLRYWCFGWRVWPSRTPARHRYLFRNTLWLLKRSYVPKVWKFWAIVKLCLTLGVHSMFDSRRIPQLRAMMNGLRRGIMESGRD